MNHLKVGELWQDSGFVFTGQLGQALHFNVLVTQFKRLIRQSGLPELRLHDLRHTSATLLLAQGCIPRSCRSGTRAARAGDPVVHVTAMMHTLSRQPSIGKPD
jgi:integrase